jgi:aldehyde dehydrogenase (NAD+)
MFAFKIGPGILAGNTIVLKSSEKAPLSLLRVAKCIQDAGIPKGVINILSGFGRPCGEAIAKHMEIRKLSFTGSALAGRAIKKAAADSNLKTVTLELGGKSPLIIFEDADIPRAVAASSMSILANSGQICVSTSRVYVHASIADAFIAAMKSAMVGAGKAADPLKADTMRGPQADKHQFDRVMDFFDIAKTEKHDIAIGGGREGSTGYFVEPTIIINVPETSRLMKEEIFGPVVCINTFTEEEDAIRRANDSEFGLFSSVFTKDISRALRVAKRMEAGQVGINCSSPINFPNMSFGGWKSSGEGMECGQDGLNQWTEKKSVFIAL